MRKEAIILNEFKNKIRKCRINKNMSQRELAEYMGYESQSTISMWESGTRMPNIVDLKKLADCFGVSTDYLLNSENSVPVKTS